MEKKTIKVSVGKQTGVFVPAVVAKSTKEQFVKDNMHSFENASPDECKKALESAYDKCVAATTETASLSAGDGKDTKLPSGKGSTKP